MSLTDLGVSHSLMDLVFSGLTLSVAMMKPRNLTLFLQNSHFSGAVLNVVVLRRLNTAYTSLTCYSRDPIMKTRMSLTYVRTMMSKRSLRTLLIICCIIAGTFVSPISMTLNLQSLQYDLNAVFYQYPSAIQMLQNASYRSIFINQSALVSLSITSSIFSSRYQFLMVILFNFQQS